MCEASPFSDDDTSPPARIGKGNLRILSLVKWLETNTTGGIRDMKATGIVRRIVDRVAIRKS